ncbi:MAG: lysyl oxidase family protein [bacterium]
MPLGLRRVVPAAILVALLAGPSTGLAPTSALQPPDVESFCDMHTKHCEPVPLDLRQWLVPQSQPMSQTSDSDTQRWLVAPIRGYLTHDEYQIIQGLVPDIPTVPLAAPPGAINETVGENVTVHKEVAGITLDGQATLSATVLVPLPPEQGEAPAGSVPCTDPRGCPDLTVDAARLADGILEKRTFTSSSCAVVENSTSPGTRRLLRFTFATPNIGDGDLLIGDPAEHPSWFQWGACHGHWHFRQYAEYRLWTLRAYVAWRHARDAAPTATAAQVLAQHPELAAGFLSGHKQGFCAIDVVPYAPLEAPRYQSCATHQGISRGWADEYGYALDGQWVDMTGVAAGAYVLEAEVNPARFYQETVYTNNSGALLVVIPPDTPIV